MFFVKVARFRNPPISIPPTKPSESIRKVSAELTYTLSNGTSYVVPRALWFPENTFEVDIGYNDDRGFILAEYHNSETIYTRERSGSVELCEHSATVRVRLFSEVDGTPIDGGEFRINAHAENGLEVTVIG